MVGLSQVLNDKSGGPHRPGEPWHTGIGQGSFGHLMAKERAQVGESATSGSDRRRCEIRGPLSLFAWCAWCAWCAWRRFQMAWPWPVGILAPVAVSISWERPEWRVGEAGCPERRRFGLSSCPFVFFTGRRGGLPEIWQEWKGEAPGLESSVKLESVVPICPSSSGRVEFFGA